MLRQEACRYFRATLSRTLEFVSFGEWKVHRTASRKRDLLLAVPGENHGVVYRGVRGAIDCFCKKQ